MYGDSAYASQKALIGAKASRAKDFTNQRVCKGGEIDEAERSKNRNKSRVRYRGLAKNAPRSFVVLGLANIYLARRRLLA